MARTPIPANTQTDVILKSRRRCCICFGLNRSTALVSGQLAHLDRDASNNTAENLAFLCLAHHDEYDSKTSQRKNLTIGEVKHYRSELEQALGNAFTQKVHFGSVTTPAEDPYAGTYLRIDTGADSADIVLTPLPDNLEGSPRYFVTGFALWGAARPYGPNMGELAIEATMQDEGVFVGYSKLGEESIKHTITFLDSETLQVVEGDTMVLYGMNVTLEGTFKRSR